MTVEPIGPYAIRQFEIDVLVPLSLFGHDVSFTVSSQAMLTTVIVGGDLTWATRDMKIIPGCLQMSAECPSSAHLLDKLHDTRDVVRTGCVRHPAGDSETVFGGGEDQDCAPRFQITNSIAGNRGLTTQQPKFRVTVIAP